MAEVRLSSLEAEIVLALDHVGWHPELWFPIVQRAMLNLGTELPDEDVHRSFVGLVRRGLLKEIRPPVDATGLDLRAPEWQPTPEALAAAKSSIYSSGRPT